MSKKYGKIESDLRMGGEMEKEKGTGIRRKNVRADQSYTSLPSSNSQLQ
jgi:hypothetical protein